MHNKKRIGHLKKEAKRLSKISLKDIVSKSLNRSKPYEIDTCGIWLNYSRNHLDDYAMSSLFSFARSCSLKNNIDNLFLGNAKNSSENRIAWHPILRSPLNKDIKESQDVNKVLLKMKELCKKLELYNKDIENTITDIVCIGIGGSELGSKVIDTCFSLPKKNKINLHFIANIDEVATKTVKCRLDPKRCWFLITSKTFTTFETICNYKNLRLWVSNVLNNEADATSRFFAITANSDKALKEGFLPDNIFPFWDFVGGRFSLCSAVGLPIALKYGFDFFSSFLDGAYEMDVHFKEKELEENLPVIMALIHTWYVNGMGYKTRAVIPYSQQLEKFPTYLQQLEMESLGKSKTILGDSIDYYDTSPIVWGDAGSNGQHAFFQLLHQGTQIVPVDFIAFLKESDTCDVFHHNALLANSLAQSESLMLGGTIGNNTFIGNRPSNFILMESLSAKSLGALIALYEHKTYVQSILWGINAFDQWGVELGKYIASDILDKIDKDRPFTMKQIKDYFKN